MSERRGTKALELWCKRLVKDCPNVQIDNMTTSWRNGIAFCALVHHFRPDLIDISTLRPENIFDNNQLAYSIAEKHLGIPALLDPEDMVANEVPDRLSILTYLSQFYQRLGHTVNSKANESDSKSPGEESSSSASESSAFPVFGKSGLDKCSVCEQPVYLAQRLIVSQKMYHRRCFRCRKCSGHLNPGNYKNVSENDFICESCKTDKVMSKFLNNNVVQMGMLAFCDNLQETETDTENRHSSLKKTTSQSIIDKINMFEKNVEKDSVSNKLENLNLKESVEVDKYVNSPSTPSTSRVFDNVTVAHNQAQIAQDLTNLSKPSINIEPPPTENIYKTDIKKSTFLKTQLLGDKETCAGNETDIKVTKDCLDTVENNYNKIVRKEECNVTDDIRLANNVKPQSSDCKDVTNEDESKVNISIPPRRKKRPTAERNEESGNEKAKSLKDNDYPVSLNPFSEDEDEDENPVLNKRKSTNPFGSSDEEEDIQNVSQNSSAVTETPTKKRVIKAQNPFWSDGEEPSDDEEGNSHDNSSTYESSLTTSTPNLRTPSRKKMKAPPPPVIFATLAEDTAATSMEDVASLSSVSSYCSTIHSDQRSHGKLSPQPRKKRPAPTPPDATSSASEGLRADHAHGQPSADRSLDTSLELTEGVCVGGRRAPKGPAPGLPLPARRPVHAQVSALELHAQLDLLDAQQSGLERQGVLIEQMIRDKCEGDNPQSVPQEHIEDLVIQLCELVNEKNDLFRKQTELMYIRRQQRLEEEQADIEHEIRVIQSLPAVNRTDADKVREEQLVVRLVEVVRLRDELVQQVEAERRRERLEDRAIAASIANRRAQRTNNSMVEEVASSKKNSKVKDKMKKQLKKAKHSLIPKKKETTPEKKDAERSDEKGKKCKSKE